METTTHIKKVQHQNQSVKERVQQLLGWSDFQYADFQASMGYSYLETELEMDKTTIDCLIRKKVFWSWWINHWVKRDIVFLEQFECGRKDILQSIYRVRHNPRAIMFKPQSTILRQSYAEMMGQLIDTLHHD